MDQSFKITSTKNDFILLLNLSIFLIFFVPIFIPNSTEFLPQYFSHSFSITLIITIIGGFIVSYLLYNKTKIKGLSLIDIAFGIFVLYAIIRFHFHPLSHWSQGNYIFWLAIFSQYVLFRILFSKIQYNTIYIGLIVLAFIQIIIGQLQLFKIFPSFHPSFAITGTFSDPQVYAGFLGVLFPIALFEILKSDNNQLTWLRYLAWVVVGGILLVIVPINSWASWGSTLIGGGFVILFRYNILDRLSTKFTMLVLGIFTISIVCYFLFTINVSSPNEHALTWKISTQMWKENPVFGIGLTRFASEYNLAQADYFANGGTELEELVARNVGYAFNEFLEIAVELGLIGLLIWGILLGLALSTKIKGPYNVPVKGSILSWIVFSCFSFPLSMWSLSLLLLLFLAVLSNKRPLILNFSTRPSSIFTRVSLSFLFILGSSFYVFWIGNSYTAVQEWQKGHESYKRKDYENAQKYYSKALPTLKYDGLFLQFAGKTYLKAGKKLESNRLFSFATNYHNDLILYCDMGLVQSKLENYEEAEQCFKKAHHMIPHRLYPQYLLAKNYYHSEDRKEAVLLAKQLLKKKFGERSMATEEMLRELEALSFISY